MKKPYIKKYKSINGFDVWIVDGKYIRDKINEEFTNFGLNSRFRFIPKNEFWIEKEYGKGSEIEYYIKNLLKESELLKKGDGYDYALGVADKFEKLFRLKHEKIKFDKKTIIKKVHLTLLKKFSKKIKVYIVNGRLVRDYFFIDFTEGGHDMVYDFVPKNEVWIDDDIRRTERDFVLLHELHERNLMKNGMKYEHAHNSASTIENFCRKNPKILQNKIKEEIKKI
ncbi:hypothetical protein J4476_06195 [Candidatus Woesearchaeota archaeon]|nr:MAG: hypothetical protein QT09_C0012G0007 [archaeon GW2011_AR18]MBS3162259.1 hypothetical protein [Candidatus Woesearchaeota archaeon]HIH26179.1 hypothetical protein [Nanoarchaeota archaeon]